MTIVVVVVIFVEDCYCRATTYTLNTSATVWVFTNHLVVYGICVNRRRLQWLLWDSRRCDVSKDNDIDARTGAAINVIQPGWRARTRGISVRVSHRVNVCMLSFCCCCYFWSLQSLCGARCRVVIQHVSKVKLNRILKRVKYPDRPPHTLTQRNRRRRIYVTTRGGKVLKHKYVFAYNNI